MRTIPLLLGALPVLVLGGACRTSTPKSDGARQEPPTLSSAPRPAAPSLAARMHEHDVHAGALRDAVARADLDAARREARLLSELRVEGVIEPGWQKQLGAMNAAAARSAAAVDLAAASRDLAALAQTCGDCHAVLGGPKPAVGEPPDPSLGVAARMKRHQWAADRLWDGLIVPSTPAWRTGARVLLDAPLQPELLTPGQSPVPAIGELASSVHELGRKARVVEAAVDRVAIYGELMATCSACHRRLGGGPAAPRDR